MKEKAETFKFSARAFSTVPKHKIKVVVAELRRIAKAHNWQITPENVLDAAQSTTSVLHPYFKWDNAIAAHEYRLHQARILLNHINVSITINKEEKQARAFHVITSFAEDEEPLEVSYVPLDKILASKVLRDQMLMRALREADQWRKRYETLQELSTVFEAIEKVSKKRKRA